jgi:hypothetical protein
MCAAYESVINGCCVTSSGFRRVPGQPANRGLLGRYIAVALTWRNGDAGLPHGGKPSEAKLRMPSRKSAVFFAEGPAVFPTRASLTRATVAVENLRQGGVECLEGG